MTNDPTVYLVVAYRWGWTNNARYFVGAWTDRDTALAFAARECRDRGGKYGVTVYEFHGETETAIHHCPSSYGETEAHFNVRIELFERFGNVFVPQVDDGPTYRDDFDGDALPLSTLRKWIDDERRMLDIMHGRGGQTQETPATDETRIREPHDG